MYKKSATWSERIALRAFAIVVKGWKPAKNCAKMSIATAALAQAGIMRKTKKEEIYTGDGSCIKRRI